MRAIGRFSELQRTGVLCAHTHKVHHMALGCLFTRILRVVIALGCSCTRILRWFGPGLLVDSYFLRAIMALGGSLTRILRVIMALG